MQLTMWEFLVPSYRSRSLLMESFFAPLASFVFILFRFHSSRFALMYSMEEVNSCSHRRANEQWLLREPSDMALQFFVS